MASLTSSGLNAGYVEQLLEQYRDNPEAVDPAWRELFERADDAVVPAPPSHDAPAAQPDGNGAPPPPEAEAVAEAPPFCRTDRDDGDRRSRLYRHRSRPTTSSSAVSPPRCRS